MLRRLLVWTIRSMCGAPAGPGSTRRRPSGSSRLVRRVVGRRPVVETLSVSPGQHLTVDHLQVSASDPDQGREAGPAASPSAATDKDAD